MSDHNSRVSEMFGVIREADEKAEKLRMKKTYSQWRFGVGFTLVSIFLLIAGIGFSFIELVLVSCVYLLIGVYFMDRSIKHPSWKTVFNFFIAPIK